MWWNGWHFQTLSNWICTLGQSPQSSLYTLLSSNVTLTLEQSKHPSDPALTEISSTSCHLRPSPSDRLLASKIRSFLDLMVWKILILFVLIPPHRHSSRRMTWSDSIFSLRNPPHPSREISKISTSKDRSIFKVNCIAYSQPRFVDNSCFSKLTNAIVHENSFSHVYPWKMNIDLCSDFADFWPHLNMSTHFYYFLKIMMRVSFTNYMFTMFLQFSFWQGSRGDFAAELQSFKKFSQHSRKQKERKYRKKREKEAATAAQHNNADCEMEQDGGGSVAGAGSGDLKPLPDILSCISQRVDSTSPSSSANIR